MSPSTTETASARYRDLDTWPSERVLAAIVEAQRGSLDAVACVVPAIAAAADAVAAAMKAGGRLIYAGAGSSGLLAHVDASEWSGTFGVPSGQICVLMAGGRAALADLCQGQEDDAASAAPALDALDASPRDVLCAVSASGRTPFAVAALRHARALGLQTIAIACNADTPLLDLADHAIHLATPPEVIAGSTRMNAGTAQKCVLNMLSTLVGIRLGHGYAGLMVNLKAENAKLRERALAVVMDAAAVSRDEAGVALARGGSIKAAILLCQGCTDVAEAEQYLDAADGDVRRAITTFRREARANTSRWRT